MRELAVPILLVRRTVNPYHLRAHGREKASAGKGDLGRNIHYAKMSKELTRDRVHWTFFWHDSIDSD